MNVRKTISRKLLTVLIPMIAIAFIGLISITAIQARSIITALAESNLQEESSANAASLSAQILDINSMFNTVVEALETIPFKDDTARAEYLVSTMNVKDSVPSGLYVGMSDDVWMHPTGFVLPDDYVIQNTSWYKLGIETENFVMGTPYIDTMTGGLCVTPSRKVTFPNGRVGVAGYDMMLDSIVEEVGKFKPLSTGISILLDGDYILSYQDPSFNGSPASSHPEDTFLTTLDQLVLTGNTKVQTIRNGGIPSYVVCTPVSGTRWTLVSVVSEADILRQLNRFMIVCYLLMIIVVVVVAVVMYLLTSKIISKPVRDLTGNIEKITQGDFTVQIDANGNDEIGTMNNNMHTFVEKMRGTLGDMKNVTTQLSTEASNSKDASSLLSRQAEEQSEAMLQIRDTMEGIADSITELANNATELANAVEELTERGRSANETMTELVTQAAQGQEDMQQVQHSMDNISQSMNDMNDVVVRVGEAAKQIDSIIEMINSISSQTNLLSLNASIEAARAGEAGRGFAVVANEIGNLANESARATTEISAIITEITQEIQNLSQKSTENILDIQESSGAVVTAGETFRKIFKNLDTTNLTVHEMIDKVDKVNVIATSVAAITQEQSASTEEVTATVETVSENANKVAEESRDVDESATTVAGSVGQIEDFVNFFNL